MPESIRKRYRKLHSLQRIALTANIVSEARNYLKLNGERGWSIGGERLTRLLTAFGAKMDDPKVLLEIQKDTYRFYIVPSFFTDVVDADMMSQRVQVLSQTLHKSGIH